MPPDRTLHQILQPHIAYDADLSYLVQLVPDMHLDLRKACLTMCQAAYTFEERPQYFQETTRLLSIEIRRFHPDIRISRIKEALVTVGKSRVKRSFLSMCIRNERVLAGMGTEEAITGGFRLPTLV